MFPAHCLNRLTQLELIPPTLECAGAVGDFSHVGFSGLVAFIFDLGQLVMQPGSQLYFSMAGITSTANHPRTIHWS